MSSTAGAELAALLLVAYEGAVNEVVAELALAGHPGVTATLEFALVAINAGAQDASALGRALGVTKQAASKTIGALEQLGYVTRVSDTSDARRKHLEVTAHGEAMMTLGAAAFERIRQRWVDRVGIDAVTGAEAALRQLTDP
ncbi:MarR family winged helix-turn-helix transcriptional regulator [uncultured Microbacterium sp.]|uniref:MarR family winged helix-turn-helix transcriptional regulator n=1 Tax=uncultured Microbacterium sp. TaxID=191216 RepID=UPI003747A047